jgi:hypothetical protein
MNVAIKEKGLFSHKASYKREQIMLDPNMNIPIKEQVTMSKKVRFSVPSILVLLPNTNSKWAGARWYSQDEMESFKALFVISVAEVRMKLSRGGIDAIVATEILGMEKRLTRHVSKKLIHKVIVNLFQPLTDALSPCCSRSSQRNTPRDGRR